jgi:hypothetical protein
MYVSLYVCMYVCIYVCKQSTEPLILSVGEEDEVSIADVARAVAKAMDFTGNIVVSTTVSNSSSTNSSSTSTSSSPTGHSGSTNSSGTSPNYYYY